MTATATKFDVTELEQFSGGGDQYQHWTRRVQYTEGVKAMADGAGAYWLIDAIASHQDRRVIQACEGAQFWTLRSAPTRMKPHRAVLECRRDKNDPVCRRQVIEYTDFPFATDADGKPCEFRVWVIDTCMMLPSEY